MILEGFADDESTLGQVTVRFYEETSQYLI